ncbi:MAG: M23 family metallopeptidase [Burkholderiales bacterium]|nr:M23 family metallopeptidase [Burkholderiales bacterium]
MLALPAVVVTASVDSGVRPPAAETVVAPALIDGALVGAVDDDEVVVAPEFLSRGDTLFAALARVGVLDAAAERFLRTSPSASPLRSALPGSLVRATRRGSGELIELEYLTPGGDAWRLTRDGAGFRVARQAQAEAVQTRFRAGRGGASLFAAFEAAGLPKPVAEQVRRIFEKQFDLHAAAREIDRFAVVFEEHATPAGARPGRVLGVEVVRKGKPYRAFWFAPEGRGGDYYGPEGFTLDREFLPAPLEFTEVTSWYGKTRQIGRRFQASHPGVDYAAPIGTPVHATADGVAEIAAGPEYRGYGNVVIVKHRGSLATLYAHLDAFAPGLASGQRVRQGEVIGYVGKTGWATGPHLHYEVRVDGKPVNPETALELAADPDAPQRMSAFRARTAQARRALELLAVASPARFE